MVMVLGLLFFVYTPPETNMAIPGKSQLLIGDTSSFMVGIFHRRVNFPGCIPIFRLVVGW